MNLFKTPMVFTAKRAKELVQTFKSLNLNYQRKVILGRIKSECLVGNNYLMLDDQIIKLFEDDYKFFENLGYKVIREEYVRFCDLEDKKEYYHLTYGRISWD